MIDHVSVPVGDLVAAIAFYERVLAPLGLSRLVTRDETAGFGKRYPEFWLNKRSTRHHDVNPGAHVALRAASEQSVREFHSLAMANGATDAGMPGPRDAALTTYFGAFIIDPDGNKIEAINFPSISE